MWLIRVNIRKKDQARSLHDILTEEQEAVEVKVGLSYTSIENARFNRETEAADVTFDQAKKNATDVWNESLSRIYVEGGRKLIK